MVLDVVSACNVCLAALQKTEYCSKISAEKYFSVGSAFPVYRSRPSLGVLLRVFWLVLGRYNNISQNSWDRPGKKDAAFFQKFWQDLQTCRNVRCVHCTITGWLCSIGSVTLALTGSIRSYVGVLHERKSIMLRIGWISCLQQRRNCTVHVQQVWHIQNVLELVGVCRQSIQHSLRSADASQKDWACLHIGPQHRFAWQPHLRATKFQIWTSESENKFLFYILCNIYYIFIYLYFIYKIYFYFIIFL